MRSRKWSQLSPARKAYYRARGVTPGVYNSWWRLPPGERASLNRQAGYLGYKNGLQLHTTRLRYRSVTGKRLSRLASPQEAGRQYAREGMIKELPDIFEFDGDEHEQYTNFLSP